jgi:hypothetical protein
LPFTAFHEVLKDLNKKSNEKRNSKDDTFNYLADLIYI